MQQADRQDRMLGWFREIVIAPLFISLALMAVSSFNYLLFHTLAELFTIITGVLIFVVSVHTYAYSRQHFLMFLGIGYFWVAASDLLHTLTYKGLPIIAIDSANMSTQFWLMGRYAESLLLLSAPLLLRRQVSVARTFLIGALIFVVMVCLIFKGFFPNAFITGQGLTPFKIYSEYLICLILLLALIHFYKNRHEMGRELFPLLAASITLTVFAEISFTQYVSVYDAANLIGHVFKFSSYWLIFYMIVKVGLHAPYAEAIAASKAQAQSEHKFRDIVESINDWIWETDACGRYTYASPKVLDVLGYQPSEVLGKCPFDFMIESDAERIGGIISRLMNQRSAFSGIRNCNRHKDGRIVTLETSGVPFFDSRGNLLGYRGVDRDISEPIRLETQLRLSQKMEAIGELAAGIAHEINTPLQYLGDNMRFLNESFAELMDALGQYRSFVNSCRENGLAEDQLQSLVSLENVLDIDFLEAEVPQAVAQSLDGIRKASAIVMAMKSFSHPGTEKEQMNLNLALENVLTVSRNEWKYVAETETEFEAELPLVECSPEINQVFLNLIVNAAHAIGKRQESVGGGQGCIRLRTRHDHQRVVIEIEDNGTGIPESLQYRIFEPFFTTKEVGKGTGQGLAICHHIVVEKHAGSIELNSREGGGTTFIISLPIRAEQERADAR